MKTQSDIALEAGKSWCKDYVEEDKVYEAEIIQEETSLAPPRRIDHYKVIKSFMFQDVMLGMVSITAGDIFSRIVDEPENFTNCFIIVPESVIIDNLNFQPI